MTQRGASSPEGRHELLAGLGLPPDASDEDIRDAVASALDAPGVAAKAPKRHNSPLLLVGVALLTTVLVIGVGSMGRGTATTAQPTTQGPAMTTPTAAATPTVDAAQVAALRAKIDADPADVVSLGQLGDLYSLAGAASDAKVWHGKALALKADDPDLLLAYGVDLFNLDDYPGAISQWTRVTELKPADAEAWYNLGWAYMSSDPPDATKMDAAWSRVVELAPDSDIAKTVKNHLGVAAIASPTPTPSK